MNFIKRKSIWLSAMLILGFPFAATRIGAAQGRSQGAHSFQAAPGMIRETADAQKIKTGAALVQWGAGTIIISANHPKGTGTIVLGATGTGTTRTAAFTGAHPIPAIILMATMMKGITTGLLQTTVDPLTMPDTATDSMWGNSTEARDICTTHANMNGRVIRIILKVSSPGTKTATVLNKLPTRIPSSIPFPSTYLLTQ